MLDLTKLALQMQGMSQHLTQEAAASRQRLARATHILNQAQTHPAELIALHHQWNDRLGFTAAEPIEPLNTCRSIPTPPSVHSVLATDGSQIAPSHHEIAYCYLINIGRIALHYGQGRQPLLDSLPEVFYQAEDLYSSRQWGIRTEEWMGYRRTVSEAEALADLAQNTLDFPSPGRNDKTGNDKAGNNKVENDKAGNDKIGNNKVENDKIGNDKIGNDKIGNDKIGNDKIRMLSWGDTPIPTLALTDGSLIYWSLEALPAEARDRLLPPILTAWEHLRQLKVPLVGYLSASRSSEALNFLRLETCPHEAPDCTSHCFGKTDQAPCQVFAPLRDATFWNTRLQPGDRSPLWKSHARILEEYGDQEIYFCYVHVGSEVARLEFPAWVVADSALLDLALGLTLAQVQKGYGYPVALAEAHNQAVVRGGDRHRFFALLEQQMVRAGLRNVSPSYKETRKRGSIA